MNEILSLVEIGMSGDALRIFSFDYANQNIELRELILYPRNEIPLRIHVQVNSSTG